MIDKCGSCFWQRDITDEELRKFVGKDSYCHVFPANPNPIPVNRDEYCGLHRPKKVGFEVRLGGWVIRIEHKRWG